MLKVNVIWIPDIKARVNVALSINLEGNILSYFFLEIRMNKMIQYTQRLFPVYQRVYRKYK